jgi:hypothetical protein
MDVIRQLLAPTATLIAGKYGKDVKLEVNPATDALDLVWDGRREKILDRTDIDNNTYKTEFMPRVRHFLGGEHV